MGKSASALPPIPTTFTSARVGRQIVSQFYMLTVTITRTRGMTGRMFASAKQMVRSTACSRRANQCGLRRRMVIGRRAEVAQTCRLGRMTAKSSSRDGTLIPKLPGNTSRSVPIRTISIVNTNLSNLAEGVKSVDSTLATDRAGRLPV